MAGRRSKVLLLINQDLPWEYDIENDLTPNTNITLLHYNAEARQWTWIEEIHHVSIQQPPIQFTDNCKQRTVLSNQTNLQMLE
eukprot:scaffold5185_cov198-Alexandrium_tamarense.AAC.35